MILLLIAIEQGIKIIAKDYYGVKAPILENTLYFTPTLNDSYSYINLLFNLGWGRTFHIIMVILFLFFVFDLKDCYLTIFSVLAIMLVIKNWKEISKINDTELLKDYIGFIKNDFLSRGE